MKVTKVYLLPTSVKIEGISCGKEVIVEGVNVPDVAKKAMKVDHYFTRDVAIIEDIKLVLWEQMQGIREDPNAPGVLAANQQKDLAIAA